MSGDICDWLAKEEEDAEQWGGMGGALFYREQFAAARNEIVRLRAVGDALVAAIRSHDLTEANVKAWEEARRG